MKLHIHKYKKLESADKEICIRCGKIKGLPFFPFGYQVLKLHFTCWLWEVRGLQSCPLHGFYAQSYINGYCKKCERKEWTEEEIKQSEESCEGLMY